MYLCLQAEAVAAREEAREVSKRLNNPAVAAPAPTASAVVSDPKSEKLRSQPAAKPAARSRSKSGGAAQASAAQTVLERASSSTSSLVCCRVHSWVLNCLPI